MGMLLIRRMQPVAFNFGHLPGEEGDNPELRRPKPKEIFAKRKVGPETNIRNVPRRK